jgi:hypothetical protein
VFCARRGTADQSCNPSTAGNASLENRAKVNVCKNGRMTISTT